VLPRECEKYAEDKEGAKLADIVVQSIASLLMSFLRLIDHPFSS
jgi:predicted house-cleaning noncanonical NTP pyrophosphatase (MazG superfamily)